MSQLKNEKIITNSVVSFYLSRKEGRSVIKFGSYDERGLRNSKQFYIFQTINTKNWSLSFSDLIIKKDEDIKEIMI